MDDSRLEQDPLHQIQEQLNKLHCLDNLGSLLDLQKQLSEVQVALLGVQSSLAFQGDLLTEVRSLVQPPEKKQEIAVPKKPTQHTSTTQSGDPLDVDGLVAPSDEPPMLIPGEIVSPQRSRTSNSCKTRKTFSVVSAQSGHASRPASRSGTMLHPGFPKRRVLSMEDVEAHTANALLSSPARSHQTDSPTVKHGSVSLVEPVAEQEDSARLSSGSESETSEKVQKSNEQEVELVLDSEQRSSRRDLRSQSRHPQDGKKVLQMCRRMSLDDLRLNHDAVIANTQRTDTNTRPALSRAEVDTFRSGPSCSFSRFARLWLALVGIIDFPSRRPNNCALLVISMVLIIMMGALVSLTTMGLSDPYISTTTLCYMVGVLVAVWRLRWSGVKDLLVRTDGLEDYAMKSGFLDEWRRTSRRRLQEVIGFLVVMLCCRWLAWASNQIWDLQTLERAEVSGCFSVFAILFSAIIYLQLHIVAGLEHAIDSFSINFYSDMDIEVALDEWNMVQATLRQVSTKLSATMLLLGSSCGASLLMLVELTVLSDSTLQPGLKSGLPFFCFTSWLFPPVLLFLYSMLRAAGVTEKASRVAPLVNSWNFDNDEDDNVPSWMDLGRQYIVQYMIQSEAGFYLQGMRLHAFQVTKLCYYFAAFIFALFSRSWA